MCAAAFAIVASLGAGIPSTATAAYPPLTAHLSRTIATNGSTVIVSGRSPDCSDARVEMDYFTYAGGFVNAQYDVNVDISSEQTYRYALKIPATMRPQKVRVRVQQFCREDGDGGQISPSTVLTIVKAAPAGVVTPVRVGRGEVVTLRASCYGAPGRTSVTLNLVDHAGRRTPLVAPLRHGIRVRFAIPHHAALGQARIVFASGKVCTGTRHTMIAELVITSRST